MTRVALLLLGGCTSIFGLESPTRMMPVEDADLPIDMAIDGMRPCTPLLFDEDGDAIDDACDGCPTIASDEMDADGDGLPNACDYNLAPNGDRILLARMFTSAGELADLDPNSATWVASGDGVVALGDGGRLRASGLMPLHIEVRVSEFTGTDDFEIKAPGATCKVSAQTCSGGGSGMCLDLSPSVAELGVPSTELRRVRLYQSTAGVQCDATAGTQSTSVTGNGSLGNGSIEVRIGLDSTIVVQSFVIYGAK